MPGGFQIGDILGKLGIDTSELRKQLAAAKAEVKAFSDEAKKTAQSFGQFGAASQEIQKIQTAATRATSALRGLTQEAQKASTQAAQAVSRVGSGLKIGDVADRLGLSEITRGFASAGAAIQRVQSQVAATKQGLLDRQQTIQIAQAIGSNLRTAILGAATAFATLGRGAVGAFRLINSGIRTTIGSFRSLFRSVLSIRTALVGLGVVSLFRRAGEVDNLTGAFRSLSRSIGALSDNFLARLRRATRGTISDLELMRLTNNAILLDVARNADGFVKLAEAARRLGQATGRTTTQAMEDLNLGIGRQSRLLLDNLGIIVKVQKAYEKYAVSIGKTATQLTQSEQRFAFQQEVFRAIEERVATLGPDLETVGQAVQRLGATLQNVFSDVARSLLSRGSVAAIADLLERNRPRIRAFVAFVRESVDAIVGALATGFQRLRTPGGLNVAELLDATFGAFFRLLGSAIKSLVTVFVPVMFQAGVELAKALGHGILSAGRGVIEDVGDFFAEIGLTLAGEDLVKLPLAQAQEGIGEIQQSLKKLKDTLAPQTVERLRRDMSALSDELNKLLADAARNTEAVDQAARDNFRRFVAGQPAQAVQLPITDIDARAERILKQVRGFRDRLAATIESPELEQSTRNMVAAVETATDLLSQEFSGGFSRIRQEVENSIGILTGNFESAQKALDQIAARARLRRLDPLAGIEPIQTDRFVQPYADIVNKVIALRERVLLNTEGLARALGNLPIPGLDKFFDKVRQGFEPLAIQLSAVPIQSAINLVDVLNTQVTKFRSALAPKNLDPEAFAESINKLERQLQDINFDTLAIGATAGTRAVLELQKAFDGVRLSDSQKADVDLLAVRLRAAGSANEAATAIANLREELEAVGQTQAGRTIRNLIRDLKELTQTPAFKLDADTIQAEFEKIRPLAPFEEQAPKIKEQIDEIGQAVRSAFEAGDTAGIERAVENIASLGSRLDDIKFDPITQKQANAIKDQIASIGAQLRAALDARAAVKKTEDAIQKLRDLEIKIKIDTDIREAREKIKQLQDDADNFGLRPGEVISRDLERQIQDLQASGTLTTEQLARFRRAQADALNVQGQIEFQDLTKGVSDSVFGGILEGFERGEKESVVWSRVVSDTFRKSMGRVIDQLTNQISSAFGELFKQAGLGVGAADFATGLIGIGSSILVGLRNRRDQTVNDFAQQVNSSEAIRGVVAGPTNVAIAKVGDSLKVALRQTEILLERIAVSVERGGGGGGGGGSGGSFGLRLTSSTPT